MKGYNIYHSIGHSNIIKSSHNFSHKEQQQYEIYNSVNNNISYGENNNIFNDNDVKKAFLSNSTVLSNNTNKDNENIVNNYSAPSRGDIYSSTKENNQNDYSNLFKDSTSFNQPDDKAMIKCLILYYGNYLEIIRILNSNPQEKKRFKKILI